MSKRNLLLLAFIFFVILVISSVLFKYRTDRPWRYHEHPEGVSVLVPHGLPTFPGAFEDTSNQKYTHVMIAEASVAEVTSYYLEHLGDMGWTMTMRPEGSDIGDQNTIEVQKGNVAYRLVVYGNEGETTIIVQEIKARR